MLSVFKAIIVNIIVVVKRFKKFLRKTLNLIVDYVTIYCGKGVYDVLDWIGIGKKIKERRRECKITQAELAERIGKTESSIRKYEKGLVAIPTDVIERIAETLETTPYVLFGPEWFDLQIGAENVKSLQRAVNLHSGIIAALEEIYGAVEEKGIMGESGLECPYWVIGKAPNSFILYEKDIETLVQSTKAFIPALVDRLKDTRPEAEIVQEITAELNK